MKILRGLIGLVALIVALVAAYYLFFAPPPEVSRTHGPEDKSPSPVLSLPPSRKHPPAKKTIAIIIDDIGYSLSSLAELLKIEAPLAFAILPHSPHAGAAAAMIHRRGGHEILLHLPMEPHDAKKSPGPGALFHDMTESEIRERLAEDLAAVPQAVGVNNHMGSAFMEDEEKLYLVLKELQKRGLFFIDSRTTAASRGKAVAARTAIPFAARSLFLDNDSDQEVVFHNLLNSVAKSDRLSMVIIGHPHPGTVRALQKAVPLLQAQGLIIVPPSDIVASPEEKTRSAEFN